jgi:hypothetical protein
MIALFPLNVPTRISFFSSRYIENYNMGQIMDWIGMLVKMAVLLLA